MLVGGGVPVEDGVPRASCANFSANQTPATVTLHQRLFYVPSGGCADSAHQYIRVM